ncbi:MAG: hypothetical protein E7445_02755 [Ruminococcaceae bacterium]|nr:hypothetical protein [Oscillospiraceae bacterium]
MDSLQCEGRRHWRRHYLCCGGAFKRYNSYVNCVSLTLPSTVTKLEDYAFGDLTAMTELNLSEGLKTIGDFAFSGCTSLTPYPTQIALHTGA